MLKQYDPIKLQQAVDCLKEGVMGRNAASKHFGIPKTTLTDIMHKRCKVGGKPGPKTILSDEEETLIVKWIISCQEIALPVSRKHLQNTIQKIVQQDGRKNPFHDNKPGGSWFNGFLKRNPVLTERIAEPVSLSRILVTEVSLRKWACDCKIFLENIGNSEILLDPTRIFNADETSFRLDPKSSKIIGVKGSRNIQTLAGARKSTITVLATFNAEGRKLEPCIVYPLKKKPSKEIVMKIPADANITLAHSETGWMKRDVFFEYLSNTFNNELVTQKIKKPVILFVDGHSTHLSMECSLFCDKNGIILYGLYPNSTHLCQAADVGPFKPLKTLWANEVELWRQEHPYISLTISNFAPIFWKAWLNLSTTSITNGFRKSGLYPFDIDAIDMTKLLPNKRVNLDESTAMTCCKGVQTDESFSGTTVGKLTLLPKSSEAECHIENHPSSFLEMPQNCQNTHEETVEQDLQYTVNHSNRDTTANLISFGHIVSPVESSSNHTNVHHSSLLHVVPQSPEVISNNSSFLGLFLDCSQNGKSDCVTKGNNHSNTITNNNMEFQKVSVDLPHWVNKEFISPAFTDHIFTPVPPVKKSNLRRSAVYPSAISSSKWREMYSTLNAKKEQKPDIAQKPLTNLSARKKLVPKKQIASTTKIKQPIFHSSSTSSIPILDHFNNITCDNSAPSTSGTRAISKRNKSYKCSVCNVVYGSTKDISVNQDWLQCRFCAQWAHLKCGVTSTLFFECINCWDPD